MATLKNSRGKFFNEHRMPSDQSFWYYYFDYIGKLDSLPEKHRALSKHWKPQRSNCPELTNILENLIQVLPLEWRALANNLFVGRVLKGDLNATAWTEKKAGVVEINIQYTFVLSNYIAVFDQFREAIEALAEAAALDDENKAVETTGRFESLTNQLIDHWSEINNNRHYWNNIGIVYPGKPSKDNAPTLARKAILDDVEFTCEEFIIAHELSHHLLGHTVSRRDKKKAKEVLDRVLTESGVSDFIIGLSRDQQDEIQADLLAFLIASRGIDNNAPDFGYIYGAIFGSTISLLALAHSTGNWRHNTSSTHPGFIIRFEAIQRLVYWLSYGRPRDSHGGHPLGQLAQLAAFVSVAYQAYDADARQVNIDPKRIYGICDKLLGSVSSLVGAIPDLEDDS